MLLVRPLAQVLLTAKMAELAVAAATTPDIGDYAERWCGKEETLALCPDADVSMFKDACSLVRLTRVGGGWIPCGGTHVATVADIGAVRVTRAKAKKNTLKVSYELDGVVPAPSAAAPPTEAAGAAAAAAGSEPRKKTPLRPPHKPQGPHKKKAAS